LIEPRQTRAAAPPPLRQSHPAWRIAQPDCALGTPLAPLPTGGRCRRRLFFACAAFVLALAPGWRTAGAAELRAASPDGRFGASVPDTGASPPLLLLRGAGGEVLREYPVRSLDGRAASGVNHLVYVNGRGSFVLAPKGLNELWEISLDPRAEPIFDGLVHDYRMGEGIARPGFLGVRRSPQLPAPVRAVWHDGAHSQGRWLLVAYEGDAHPPQVLHLDVRRAIRTPAPRAWVEPLGPGVPPLAIETVDGGGWLLRIDPLRDEVRWRLALPEGASACTGAGLSAPDAATVELRCGGLRWRVDARTGRRLGAQ